MSRTLRSVLVADVAGLIGLAWAFAGSHNGESAGGIRIFALCVLVAFALNIVAYVPSYVARTETYYDLTGSITYVSVTLIAVLATNDRDARTVLLAALVLVWALRLGSFLFARVRRAGGDSRFDTIKHDWARFLSFWVIQALWVTITAGAALAAITSADKEGFGVLGAIGLLIWVVGFGIEVVADAQKKAFRADPSNSGRFIDTGLWAWSRHPNYFGELVLWIGVALIALPALSGWQYLTLVSPLFVYLLLTRVSGVPALEKAADERWGGQPDYESYKSSTPVFFPSPPST